MKTLDKSKIRLENIEKRNKVSKRENFATSRKTKTQKK